MINQHSNTALTQTRAQLSEWSTALARIRELERETSALLCALEENRAEYETLSHPPPDGMPRGAGNNHDLLEAIERAEKARQAILKAIGWNYDETVRLYKLKTDMDAAVRTLPGRQPEIIRARYAQVKRWEDIARDFHTDERTARRWERRALEGLAR